MHSTADDFQKLIDDISQQSPYVDPDRLAPTWPPSGFGPAEGEVEPQSDVATHSKATDVMEPGANLSIQNDHLRRLPEIERPRERMHQLGPAGITTTELLAIILGSGIPGKNVKNLADELLVTFEGLRGLSKTSSFNISKIDGIGSIKADVMTAAFELGRRAAQEDVEHTVTKNGYGSHMPNGEAIAWTIAKHFTSRLRDSAQEEMWIAFLDVRNRFKGKTRVYIGCCDQLVAKTGEILSRVVERNFPRYALIHNHPSGKGDPSGADISFTERLVKAGHLLDIELVDHVVLGEDMSSCVSMRQRKLVDFTPLSRANIKLSEHFVADSNLPNESKQTSSPDRREAIPHPEKSPKRAIRHSAELEPHQH